MLKHTQVCLQSPMMGYLVARRYVHGRNLHIVSLKHTKKPDPNRQHDCSIIDLTPRPEVSESHAQLETSTITYLELLSFR